MSILDTFIILFKPDTEQLEKGHKQAEKSTKELQERIKKTNDDVMGLGASFMDLTQKAAAAVGVTLGLASAVSGIISSSNRARTMGLFAENIGQSVGQVDALSQAVMRYGGSLDEALGLQNLLSEGLSFMKPYAAFGDTTPMPTQLSSAAAKVGIGIGPGMSQEDVLRAINKRLQGVDDGTANQLLKILGISGQGNQAFLKAPSEEFEKTLKHVREIKVLEEENTKKLQEFYKVLLDINQQLRNIGVAIAAFSVDSKTIEHLKLLARAIIAVGAAITIVMLPSIIAFMGALIAANPILTAIVASILILWHLFEAGKIIAEGMEKAFMSVFKKIGEWAKAGKKELQEFFEWIVKWVDAIKSLSFEKLFKQASKDAEKEENIRSEAIKNAKHAINTANTSPLSAQTASSLSNNNLSSTVRIDKVEIQTQATDADGIANSFEGALKRHINYAINNFNTGVRA